MKKIMSVGLLGLAALAVLSLFLIGPGSESSIEREIEKANYCNVKEDCIDAGGRCPFGCYVYVNKNEVQRIRSLMASFVSGCVYGCLHCPDVACRNGTCEPVCS